MTVLTATLRPPEHPASERVVSWLLNDRSALMPGWFSWSANSGEGSISVPLETSREIRNVSTHEALVSQLEERAKTEMLWQKAICFVPRTTLGKTLWELRQKIVASAIPLLTWDEIEMEIRQRRGESDQEESV